VEEGWQLGPTCRRGEGEKQGTGSGEGLMGRDVLVLGCLGPLLFFPFFISSFSLIISVFIFSLYLLHTLTKQGQTNF
jgi:hypothetical protein